MFSLKVEVIFLLAWLALIPALTLGESLGQLRLVLSFSGVYLVMVWLFAKGLDVGATKFIAGKRKLTYTLVSMGLAVAIGSAGGLDASIQPSSGWGLDLEILGVGVFLIGLAAMILVLITTDDSTTFR